MLRKLAKTLLSIGLLVVLMAKHVRTAFWLSNKVRKTTIENAIRVSMYNVVIKLHRLMRRL